MEVITDKEQLKEMKAEKTRAYMREYMRKKYHEDKDKQKAYTKSVKCKVANNLSSQELKEYGIYLADVHKLRIIRDKLPADLLHKVLNENITLSSGSCPNLA
jgi:hypothetical protein